MAATAQLRLGFTNDRDMLARFGVELVSTLEVDGVSIPEKLSAKERVFTFPVNAAELRLKVSIDAVDATGGSAKSAATLKVEQKLLINLNQPKPHFHPAGPVPFVDKLDPRLSVSALHQGGVVLQVTLDLLCVDVTEHARLHKLAGMVAYDTLTGFFNGARGSHYGCELRVLEFATAPKTWFVLVPPKARTVAAPGVLVFYRPKGAAYADSDAILGSRPMTNGFLRYASDPPKTAPWHVNLPNINPFSNCGLERQIGECDKPVIFVYPFPDAGGFGNALGPNLLPHLNAALRTLATTPSASSGTVLGNGVTTPIRRGRLGLAGFSYGGAACLTTFKDNSGSVDELYLCDPANMKNSEGIPGWWQGKNKRLGLIGGFFFLGSFRIMARQLEQAKATNPKLDSEVHLFPKDSKSRGETVDGFENSSTYIAALAQPGKALSSFADQFEREPDGTFRLDANKKPILAAAPAAGTLSAASGVFFVRFTEAGGFTNTVLGGRDAAGKPFEFTVAKATHDELAARAVLLWLTPDPAGTPAPGPLVTRAALVAWGSRDDLEAPGQGFARVGDVRHQWPVVGGEGSPDRGPGFKGFLQLCLEKSAF